jgi:hypothetical protein
MSKKLSLEIDQNVHEITDAGYYIADSASVKILNFAAMSEPCKYGYNIQLLVDDKVINETIVAGENPDDRNLMFGNFNPAIGNMDIEVTGNTLWLKVIPLGGGAYRVRALVSFLNNKESNAKN